jgi:hypothetical protein
LAVTIKVARVGHLLALKVLSRDDNARPQDIADLRALLRVADADDTNEAREALGLIAARGYDRDRHLLPEFEALLQ